MIRASTPRTTYITGRTWLKMNNEPLAKTPCTKQLIQRGSANWTIDNRLISGLVNFVSCLGAFPFKIGVYLLFQPVIFRLKLDNFLLKFKVLRLKLINRLLKLRNERLK